MIPEFEALQKSVEDVDNNIDRYILDAVRINEDFIVELNRDKLFSGKDSNAKKIRPKYAPSTIIQKRRKGQPSGRVTLRDTGDFYKDTYIEYGSDEFEITSSNFKTEILKEKYGDGILGLTKRDTSKVGDEIKPDLVNIIKAKIL